MLRAAVDWSTSTEPTPSDTSDWSRLIPCCSMAGTVDPEESAQGETKSTPFPARPNTSHPASCKVFTAATTRDGNVVILAIQAVCSEGREVR